MIQIINKRIPVECLDGLVISGESRIETEVFAVPMLDQVDVTQLSYTLKLKSIETGERVIGHLNKVGVSPDGNQLLEWEITEDYTRRSGNHRLEIEGISADGEIKYKAVSGPFKIIKDVGPGDAFPPKSEVEVYLETSAKYAAQAELSAQKAKEEADRAENIAGNITPGGGGGGTSFTTDETLTLENGVLSVNTADSVEQDNTLPITSAAVHTTVGNIEILLSTI